jgi:hypothetical protein
MEGGYLLVETSLDQPGLVRIRKTYSAPRTDTESHQAWVLRYAAHFDDLDAARMHAHGGLRRKLADVDAGLYRADLTDAIAAVESIQLPHRSVYPARTLTEDTAVAAAIEIRRRRHRLAEWAWQAAAAVGVVWLLVKLALGI